LCVFEPKIQIWVIFEGLEIEKICIFYEHFEYITDIWYILCTRGIEVAIWYIFPHFGLLKNLATLGEILRTKNDVVQW
jgi:hypothetical protein